MFERNPTWASRLTAEFVAQLDPEAHAVLADKPAILQVLANFLQNALRIAPRGSEIVVTANGALGYTHFAVADRGPGVLPADRERVFLPFERGPTRVGGSGLGLAIARGLVKGVFRGRLQRSEPAGYDLAVRSSHAAPYRPDDLPRLRVESKV